MIEIKVSDNHKRFIDKCIKNNINLYNITYLDDLLLVSIDEADLDLIKKENYYSKIEINKYLGKKGKLLIIKNNMVNLIYLIVFIVLIYLISNLIVSVEIRHENKDIIAKVSSILDEKNIKKYTLKKDLNELNKISDEILNDNRDFLDFISINRIGMKYIVSIEERKIIKEEKGLESCHIVAKKDGTIENIITTSGITLVEKGNLVKKGDILISGEIILNEEVKENVCAHGEVYANTWYKVTISYPLRYIDKILTKREKINIKIFNKYLKKKLYDNYDEKRLFKIFNIELVKQKEYELIENKYDVEEAKSKALIEIEKKLYEKINQNLTIKDKKVLKENINDSTIELEVFVSATEQIGELQEYKVGDINDTSESIQHTN